MKEQGSWPWWPWSDPGEKAVRECDIRERKKKEDERVGRRLEKKKKKKKRNKETGRVGLW